MYHGSGDDRDFFGISLPTPTLKSRPDLVNGLLELLIFGEEMRGNPDTRPYSVVYQDVSREKVLRDLISVGNIERHRPASLRRVPRRVYRMAALVRQLHQT